MLQVNKLMLAFVEDVVENEPWLVRNSLRRWLKPLCARQDYQTLRLLTELEADTVSGEVFSHTAELLQFSRFLKKFGCAPFEKPSDTLQNFHDVQEHLATRSQDRLGKELEFVKEVVASICTPIRHHAIGRHGPGTSAERVKGLEKSLVGVDLRDSSSIDPLKRLRQNWCNTPKRTRMLTVPKDWRRDRIIGAEPTWRMFRQKALCQDMMRGTGDFIPYTDQGKHIGRLRDDSVTVDLSAASDFLTVDVIELLFPDDLLLRAWDCRTDAYSIGATVGRTNSFALMGNGFCFPFLSITCISLALAAFLLQRGERRVPPRDVLLGYCESYGISAFGDDIIVPDFAYPLLQTLLLQAGLKLNREKSAFKNVQETCGVWRFRYPYGWRTIKCCYLKSVSVTGVEGLANCSLQRELRAMHLHRVADELGMQLMSLNRDIVSLPTTANGGDGFYVHMADVTGPRKRSAACQTWGYRVKTLVEKKRTVVLADGDAFFWAFHGGIPPTEPASGYDYKSVFIQDLAWSLPS